MRRQLNYSRYLINFVGLQLIGLSFLEGIWDSVKNIVVVFYLDSEMNKKMAQKSERASSDPSKKSSRDKEKKAE